MLSDKSMYEIPQKIRHYLPCDITKQINRAVLHYLGYIEL
jgi:hypothetical protein